MKNNRSKKLDKKSIIRKFRIVQKEGIRKVKQEVVCVNFAHTTKHGSVKGKNQLVPKGN